MANEPVTAETPEERFGALLRRERERAGLTVRQLADRLHRAHSGIVEFERGRRLPGPDAVEQIEDVLGLARGALGAARERARVQRLEWPRDGTVETNLGHVPCPYMGLRAFESEDAPLYYGRETQVDDVLTRLAATRFVAVVGASGSGKSSFVRAGLVAGMRRVAGSIPRFAQLTPGEMPVEALAGEIARAVGADDGALARELRADSGAVVRAARQGDGALVLVVDQLEELFTLCHDEAQRRSFVDALVSAWRDPASPVVVIVALRADFYGRVAAYPRLAAAVVAHQELIGPMTTTDLRRAIEQPAARSGLLLQAGLAQAVLDDLADQPGALPLLSHALLETWKRRRRLQLTLSGYQDAGGVRGAIAQTAEQTLQSLSDHDRAVARSIFVSLTEVGEGAEPTGRRVDCKDLVADPRDGDRVQRVLGMLADARLVSVDADTVAVAHEALIRHWPRLRGWIEADRAGLVLHRRLADAAREWKRLDREPGALYRGARLVAACEWATDHSRRMSPLEREFLAAGRVDERREIEAARQRARRLRILAGGLAGLAAVSATLTIAALRQRSSAREQATEARSLALAASATQLLDSRPDAALVLALEANREGASLQTERSAFGVLQALREAGVRGILRGHTDVIQDVAFSPDHRTLASASDDGTIRVWDVRARKQVGELPIARGREAKKLAFSPDGGTLASVDGRAVRLWNVRTRTPQGEPIPLAGPAFELSFGGDGRALFAHDHHTVRAWDVPTHERVGRPLSIGEPPSDTHQQTMALSPDGHTLAVAGSAGTIALWDLRTRDRRASLRSSLRAISDLAFSPDGRVLAAGGGFARLVELWDVGSHKRSGRLLAGDEVVSNLTFAPDGKTLASVQSRTIDVWDLRPATLVTPDALLRPAAARRSSREIEHAEPVYAIAFSPDGRTLASAGTDTMIRLWAPAHGPQSTLAGPVSINTGVALTYLDGRPVVGVANPDGIRLRDARTGEARGFAPIVHPGPSQLGMAFTRDARLVATFGDARIELWDARSARRLGDFPQPGSAHDDVTAVAFSPDRRLLASAGWSGIVRLWDMRTHRPTGASLRRTTGAVTSLAFSPDGRLLATGGIDAAIRLWDVKTRKPVGAPLTGHAEAVDGLAFNRDGRRLVSFGYKTFRVWDVASRSLLETMTNTSLGAAVMPAFSPDERSLWMVIVDGSVERWEDVLWNDFRELQADVCRIIGTGLSKADWKRFMPSIPYRSSCPST